MPPSSSTKKVQGKITYTTLTNFSTKYLVMCKVYSDVGGIKLYHVCPPVRKIIHSLKLVDYLRVHADNPWYNLLVCWLYPFYLAEASTITRSITSYIVGDLRPLSLVEGTWYSFVLKFNLMSIFFSFLPKMYLDILDNILWYYCNMLAKYCNISRYAYGIS